jgi:hypothetical protein
LPLSFFFFGAHVCVCVRGGCFFFLNISFALPLSPEWTNNAASLLEYLLSYSCVFFFVLVSLLSLPGAELKEKKNRGRKQRPQQRWLSEVNSLLTCKATKDCT